MSILTRDEFIALVDEYGRAAMWQDVEGEGRRVAEAYDAALARIAELEKENVRIRRLVNATANIMADSVYRDPALRARIAREFLEEASKLEGPYDMLERWEAAAKEGE